jgi:hypothetical protein
MPNGMPYNMPNGTPFFVSRQLRLLFTTKACNLFSYSTPLILMLPADTLYVYNVLCIDKYRMC